MHWPPSLTDWLTYQNSKVPPEVLENRKFVGKFGSIYKLKTADRMKAGFPLNNKPKQAENTAGCHHARSHNRFRDIRLQFMPVRTILKNRFPYIFSWLSAHSNKSF